MLTTLENRKKVTTNSPISALKRKNIIEEGRGLRLKSEEGTRKHISKGTKNDQGQSGTIYNANNGKGNVNSRISKQTNCKDTTNDNSTRDTTKGA
jgi:hypothetical protein